MIHFSHINIIARDWKRLALFYEELFGCVPVPPARDLSGEWIDTATGRCGVHITGAHLRLPGCGDHGPTLEIFRYEPAGEECFPEIDRTGFAHIAFRVEDLERTLERVIAHGGSAISGIVSTVVAGAGRIDFVYARDPEGNIIELQRRI
jgi:predicted enzyme related to lactoylglutathione lyase